MDINKTADNFMIKTLWLWLPFYALLILSREFIQKRKK